MNSYMMYAPTRVLFGAGQLSRLHEQKLPGTKALGMEDASKPQDFITALAELQKLCGVDNLKMSDFGFRADEMDKIAVNARETMGGLFLADPCELDHDGCVDILKKSYR